MSDIVKFHGNVDIKTKIATKNEEVDEAIKSLISNSSNHYRLIGLDMIPIRVAPGPSTSGKTSSAILQLCDSSQCLIDRLHSFYDVPESLYNFMILSNFTFAGFGIKDTKDRLEKDYGLVLKNVVEVGPPNISYLQHMRTPPTSSISKPWGCGLELTKDEIVVAVSNAYFSFIMASSMLP